MKVVELMSVEPTGYWTFFCNPNIWQIDLSLKENPEGEKYLITDWQAEWFMPSQLGVLRVSSDRRSQKQLAGRERLLAGIYTLYEVTGLPRERGEAGKYWIEPPVDLTQRLSVDVRILKNMLESPLLLKDLADDPQINDKWLIKGFQAATMPLDPGTFNRIVELVGHPELITGDVVPEPANTDQQLADLEKKYADASPSVREKISQQIERGCVAETVKRLNNYKCQVCEQLGLDPIGFQKLNGTPYVEAHHVMPIAERAKGSLGPSNIITVCANHHRQLHYGKAELVEENSQYFVFRIDQDTVRVGKT